MSPSQRRTRRTITHAPLILLLLAATAAADTAAPTTQGLYVSPATVKSWMDEGRLIRLLDVREPDEFAAGHIAGAINIPHEQVAAQAAQLPRDRPIVLYCIHSAHRAPAAAQALRALGLAQAYVMEGGIVAWQAGGLTLRAGDLALEPTILPKTERCDRVAYP